MKRLLILVAGLAALQSCKDDPETGFRAPSGTGAENTGQQSVVIDLGHAVSAETVVSLFVGGDASLDGDYTASSSNNTFNSSAETLDLTVKKGESSVTLNFSIIDDTQIETGREVIYFQVASVAGSDASLDHGTYMYEITDNDNVPASGLQVDLAWNIGEGVSINRINFDLYLATDVVVSGEEVTASILNDTLKSVNAHGFENFILPASLPNDEYYLVFRYAEGASDVELFVTFSQGASVRPMHGVFSEEYAGKDIYYGPIIKNSSRYNYRSASSEEEPTYSFEKASFFHRR
jgi:hypothetical protein